MGTMRLSKPPTQIKMEQNNTASRTFILVSAGRSFNHTIDSSIADSTGR